MKISATIREAHRVAFEKQMVAFCTLMSWEIFGQLKLERGQQEEGCSVEVSVLGLGQGFVFEGKGE